MPTAFYRQFDTVRINADGFIVPVASATINVYNVTAASSLGTISSDSSGVVAEGSFTANVGDVIQLSHATYPLTQRFTLRATLEEAYTAAEDNIVSYVLENLYAEETAGRYAELWAHDIDNPAVAPVLVGGGYSGETVEISVQKSIDTNWRIYPVTVDENLNRARTDFNSSNYEDVAIEASSNLAIGGAVSGGTSPRLLTSGAVLGETPSIGALQSVRRNSPNTAWEAFLPPPLFSHFVDRTTVSNSATDVHVYNVSRDKLKNNGDSIRFGYTVSLAANADDKYVRVFFAGTEIFDSGDVDPALGNADTVRIQGEIVRVNTSTVRCSVGMNTIDWNPYCNYTQITGLDLPDRLGNSPGTAYDLKLQFETPDLAGDATLRHAWADYIEAGPADMVTTSLWAYGEARYFKGTDVAQYADGANITTDWQDLSGNGRHAVRTGTPTYELAECNGEAAVRLPGGSVYFTFPDMSGLSTVSIFLVWKITDTSTDGGNRMGTSANTDHYPLTADSHIYSDFASSVRKDCGASKVTVTNYHVTHIWSKASDWGMEQNGMLVHSTGTNTVAPHSSPRLGHNGSAGMKADLVGWYIFSNKPTTANKEKEYRYIAKEFGV